MKDNAVTKDIQKDNRRALPKFLLFLGACFLVGLAIGFGAAGWQLLASRVGAYAGPYVARIALAALVVMAVLLPAGCAPRIGKVKQMMRTWDGETEEVSDQADRQLTIVLGRLGLATTLDLFFFTAAMACGLGAGEGAAAKVLPVAAYAAMAVVLVEALVMQCQSVDLARQLQPEKQGSVLDLKFRKKWEDSCDEAEKLLMGKCAYKAYVATTYACLALSFVCMLMALLSQTGFLPALAVCIIWVVNQVTYNREAMRYTKGR